MSLTTALNIARSSLAVSSARSEIVSRNVANASTPFASHKIANVVTGPAGSGVRIASITRASDQALYDKLIEATSSSAAQKVVVDGLAELDATVGDPENDQTLTALAGKLADAIQTYSSSPENDSAGRTAIAAASQLVAALNSTQTNIQGIRDNADQGLSGAADELNSLLSQFSEVNKRVMNATAANVDATDALDQRDKIVSDISNLVGVKPVIRANNDMALYTDSGVTMFDTTARSVSFSRTPGLGPGQQGSAFYIDGVPVTNQGTMQISGGAIAGYAKIRDELAPTYQNQIDEIARGLIVSYEEKDPAGVGAPAAGLLYDSSGTYTPPAVGVVPGLAGSIAISTTMEATPSRLRDGVAYNYNPSGYEGYSEHLNDLIDQVYANQSFDPAAGGASSGTVLSYASGSVSWLEQQRSAASNDYDYKNTLYERAYDAFTKETGVNIDDEMTTMLELERAYQASAKVISTVDAMFGALLQAV
jgi:flagellar hook-associated protein 1 FlgK